MERTEEVKLLPSRLVDHLRTDRWRPSNLHLWGPIDIHFSDDDHVRTIEVNHKVVAQGRALFPYGTWDE